MEHAMNVREFVVEGTLKPDGALELDQKPNLPPGRVTVVLRQEAEAPPPQEDWWQFLQNARKRMEEAGCHFMDEKEVQAHMEWLREGDQIDDLLREADEQRKKSEQP
jgi:hypothetical protein